MPPRKGRRLSPRRTGKRKGVQEIRTRVLLSRSMTRKQVEKVIDREVRKRLQAFTSRGAKILRVKKVFVGSKSSR